MRASKWDWGGRDTMKADITKAVVVAVAMLTLATATAAAADSIYLKNGRVIRTDDARVDGSRVIFFLHGAHQALPMALVDRVENDDWRGPGAPPRSPDPSVLATASDPDVDVAGNAPARLPPALAEIAPSARFDALAGFLGDGGDTTGTLSLLQALGSPQGAEGAGGLAALAPLLGALGGTGDGALGALGNLGSLGSDVVQVQAILPSLTRLGAALFAPEYSAAATDAAARELLHALSTLGVSDAEIRAKARQFGLPEDILDRIGRR